MPLPANGAPWPPPEFAAVARRIESWSAWYSGDPDQLARVYQTYGAGWDRTSAARPVNHPSQYRGGVVGTLARWFWGAPNTTGTPRAKLHLPIAADIASTSADLLFSEPPTITVEHTATQERLDELVDDGLHATLLEGAEVGAALGGVYLRGCWDRELRDRPWLSAVHADAAVPEWTWGQLSAVTFWQELICEPDRVVRLLERHEVGSIEYAVYEGDLTHLGRVVPLTEYAATERLAEVVTDGGRQATGIDRLTARYVPNMRPNRLWRGMPAAAPLGRADVYGVEPLMDALDEAWTSWMRDLRLAKARLVVPNAYLNSLGPGNGAWFDAEQELFTGLDALPQASQGMQLTPVQFAIRVAEHQQTCEALLAQILRNAGYSTQTFGEAGETAATATEVVARERRSYITRDRKIVYWRPELRAALQMLLDLDRVVFGSAVDPEQSPDLNFGDAVSEDPATVAQTVNLLAQAEAASTETKVRLVHPDWDEEQVTAEVQRIKDDTAGPPVPNPDSFGIVPPDQQPDDQADSTG